MHLLGFFLFKLGASTFREAADLFLGELTKWVADGAAGLLNALGSILTKTSTPDFTKGFPREFAEMSLIGGAVAAPLLLLAVIRAVIQQDAAELVRAALLRLPAAILLAGAAVGLVSVALAASDEMSSVLLSAAGHPLEGFIGSLVVGITAIGVVTSGPTGLVIGGFGALVLALVAAVVAFVLWLELVIRSAAVAVATLFLPLALAGLVWHATAHWARRLAETLLALILAKVVIVGTLALAAVTLSSGDGPAAVVEGIALILLATLAPFSLLRLVPMVESGAIAQFEGLSHRSGRAAFQAVKLLDGLVGGASVGGGASPGGDGLPGGGASQEGQGWASAGTSPGGGPGSGGAGGAPVIPDTDWMSGRDPRDPAIEADARAQRDTMLPPGGAS